MTEEPHVRDGVGGPPHRSLLRRLRFEGDCRALFDRMGTHLPPGTRAHRVPERIAVLAFDLVESARLGRLVPSLGDPRMEAASAPAPLPQHPRYPGYWYDPGRRSLVGMHLGVDLIRSEGTWYVLELNLSAGTSLLRRVLHPDGGDPMVRGLVEFAAAHGYRRLVALRDRWWPSYRRTFEVEGRRGGVAAVAADRVWPRGDGPGVRMEALPHPLDPETFYVVGSTRHTAVDHFVHDKAALARWLPRFLPVDARPPVRAVPTRTEPFRPPPSPSPRWPDLVVKLASWDRSRFVGFVKMPPDADPREALGIRGPGEIPTVLGTTRGHRVLARLTGRHRVLYQPFIPPELAAGDRAWRVRMHLLATPAGSAFLSAQTIVSGFSVPAHLPPGPVSDPRPYLATWSEEGGEFAPAAPEVEAELRGVAGTLGAAVHAAISESFVTGPEGA